MNRREKNLHETPVSQIDEALLRYVDDRLDVDDRTTAENWLRDNPELAERVQAWRAHDEALQRHFHPIGHAAVPERLLRASRRATQRSPLRYAAAFTWLSVGLVVGWLIGHGESPPVVPPVATLSHLAAIAHATYVPEKRHAVEVAANEEAHLVTWLSKRLDRQLKVPQLNDMGYALVGGRLLPSETGPVAQFMFQNEDGKRLTLYLRTRTGDVKGTSFQFSQEANVSVFYWLDDQLSYALSGEIERDKLLAIAHETYRQLQ
ncbi:MAG: anti-sigma factor transrane transcriptional regulator [Rhodocyclales bacterium]|nr:anti-sigma factor transrane transcriptional regulator [Rhodocyclales bacterium]MDB5887417.1 anti-sigma factor transrane transcriptional regulator [Rhodocyclales bacterium]